MDAPTRNELIQLDELSTQMLLPNAIHTGSTPPWAAMFTNRRILHDHACVRRRYRKPLV
jgi:hypothetical protein